MEVEMKRPLWFVCVIIVLLGLLVSCCASGRDGAVVHAILFYSPTCPHCHQVMDQDLPPLEKKYGKQLQVLEVDTSTPEGRELFYATLAHFQIDSAGVPLMVVGDIVLRGSREIPQYLPTLIEHGLEQGGVDWPPIPGFDPLSLSM
jgi:thiol-disulfide isomerase/thioredoxin